MIRFIRIQKQTRGHSVDGITGERCHSCMRQDSIVPPRVMGKIHKKIFQPAMLYGMETVPVTSSHVKKREVTEMKMCRWACGYTLSNHYEKR